MTINAPKIEMMLAERGLTKAAYAGSCVLIPPAAEKALPLQQLREVSVIAQSLASPQIASIPQHSTSGPGKEHRSQTAI